jgi:poly(3-hydroxybutyrate) depolymerase
MEQPAPLVVMLHGAGGDAHGGLKLLMPLADAAGLILLAPASRQQPGTSSLVISTVGYCLNRHRTGSGVQSLRD